MGKRVSNAQHLGVLLTEGAARPAETPELYRPLASKIDTNRKDATHELLTLGANGRAGAATQLTDLQKDFFAIQSAFMDELTKELPKRLSKFLP